jgi:m7GpppX diphosphatase
MLRAMRDGALAELRRRFGVRADQVRVFMHYLPSFWMAHVHFAALSCPAMGASTAAGKALLLDDIIDALDRDADHFATAALSFVVGERDPLFARLAAAGAVTACVPPVAD